MDVAYRPVTRDDRRAVAALAARAFGVAAGFMVSLKEGGHVAERDGTIVGATELTTFRAGGRRYGLTEWVMVSPDARGLGIASHLIDLAHEWFAERGMDATLALIEGYNQSSSKIFAGRGYRRLRPVDQLRVFGRSLPLVWLKSSFVVSVGHFLWYRPADEVPAGKPGTSPASPALRSVLGWLGSVLFNAFVIWILMVRLGVQAPPARILLVVIAVPMILLGSRSAMFVLIASLRGIRTRFRAWEGGSPLALAIAGAFGGYLPLPGSHYPAEEPYRYTDALPTLGPASLAALAGPLAALIGARAVVLLARPGGSVGLLVEIFVSVATAHLVVDVLPFFPLWGTAGHQVWRWSRAWWWVLAFVVAAVIVFPLVLG
ncbi:MAG: N-acetyltransferase family protein [Spirochaetota bacterium]